uniref:Uncharacterized protein n=1 Tax=Babesia bovis TaxID=5865 RepID=S6B5K4_BABBO|nr:hypothetical protein [Babesia bovis]
MLDASTLQMGCTSFPFVPLGLSPKLTYISSADTSQDPTLLMLSGFYHGQVEMYLPIPVLLQQLCLVVSSGKMP